ncbi:hypothetical protein FALBO_13649 [Fusarium albosuccineum]|uniref:Uncharacterized protein n=1 Tax=Fusarium albosuccineum TaxID=1237068 RepID=A0A8H4L1P1_9HYPO|nr:hypothetical protein FALBO_13649 [Fusarium albosuccineum]
MTHRLRAGDNSWAFMLVVIKWAVICRTDDRRPLKQVEKDVLRWTGCDFPLDPPTKPFADHHDDNRKALVEQGGWATPESDPLAAIATKTTAQSMDPSTTAGNYCVSIRDLTSIIKGLDSINTRGVTVSCEVHFQAMEAMSGQPAWRRRNQQTESSGISAASSTPIEALEKVPNTTIGDGPSSSSRIAPTDNIDDESDIVGSDQDRGSENLLLSPARDKDQEEDGENVNGGGGHSDENRANEGVMVDGRVQQVPRPKAMSSQQDLDGSGLQLSSGQTKVEAGAQASKHRQDQQAMRSDACGQATLIGCSTWKSPFDPTQLLLKHGAFVGNIPPTVEQRPRSPGSSKHHLLLTYANELRNAPT